MSTIFDRNRLALRPLADRDNRVDVDHDLIRPGDPTPSLSERAAEQTRRVARAIRRARERDRPVIAAFGAHAIKNGLAPVLIDLMNGGLITHYATNGAGIIHDWEIAFQGRTSESVRDNQHAGTFGLWDETGRYLNLAIAVGAYRGMGYGESVGALIQENGLEIPDEGELEGVVADAGSPAWRRAAAADLLATVARASVPSGRLRVEHPFREYSLQAAAYAAGVPLTGHPMIGHDIIYMHPVSSGAAIGRTAETDFLRFAEAVQSISDGVYLSVGSAIMSPMVFEKSFSMAQNVAIQEGRRIHGHSLFVVDLAEATWDWSSQGEPPADDPAYYLRFLKSFSRVGGELEYLCADNRAFFPALRAELG